MHLDVEPAGLTLLSSFSDTQRDGFLAHSTELQVQSGQLVVEAGQLPDAVYVVLSGLVEVSGPRTSRTLCTLGPGEVIGEMAWISRRPACSDVRAVENSRLLMTSTAWLDLMAARDPVFGACWYRALARSIAARLRATNARLAREGSGASQAWLGADRGATGNPLVEQIAAFKRRLVEVDRASLRNGGAVTRADAEAVRSAFTNLVERMNSVLGAASPLGDEQRNQLGGLVQAEVLPLLTLSDLGDRMYAKPRGYAGDYETIDRIYADTPRGSGRLGATLDRCILDQAAARAVQARRPLMADEIRAVIEAREGTTARVTSLASGPAAELLDVFETLGDPERLEATCVDIDLRALAHVADRTPRRLQRQFTLVPQNLVHLALGRATLDGPPQDLVYSIGLIDYFSDPFVVKLLDFVHDRLAPGGRCILGNFHPSNPTRALMDHVLEWRLIHRDEDDMNRLFAASKFGRPCSRIRYEPNGVNLFAVCERTTS